MFQPNPKPLIPLILRAKVPGWLLVAALVSQYAIMAAEEPSNPECTINVQSVHVSRYSQRLLQLSEAKFKVSTRCKSPQNKTSVDAYFEEVLPDGSRRVVRTVKNIVATPDLETPNYVLIKNITVPCNGAGQSKYFGRAVGSVHLKDGRTEKVSGDSKEFNLVNCRISAK
jgi:hypothetical protein